MKLTDNMRRMHRNACACGQRGLWVHGRAELSTAKALERRGLVRIERKPGVAVVHVVLDDIGHDRHECRTS